MRFSERTDWDREANEYTRALAGAKRLRPLLDLTVSNPTLCGFEYDIPTLLAPLSHPGGLRYTPAAFGTAEAREAVSQYYREHKSSVPAESLCLTTSTSEAYGFLFQLLCNPGDEVLIARPSYPLFEFIARLQSVWLREYPLREDPLAIGIESSAGAEGSRCAFSIDFDALRALVTERTRAIVVVHPNNPTGHFTTEWERAALEGLCEEKQLALIVDEVFLDYAAPGTHVQSFAGGSCPALCFVLSGLSKVCALPQMKLSWIAARGPEATVTEALARLEFIADTYLSLSSPVQLALPTWLGQRAHIQEQIRNRLRENLGWLDARLRGSYAGRLPFEGGWTTVLRVPRHVEGVEFALACLERGVIVQPGTLYGLKAGRAVLSLLTPPEIWRRGLELLPI